MNQNQIENIEQQLHQDRGISFRGTARIRFAHLRFGNLCPREPNKKVSSYLREKFSGEGCLRLEPKNYIPAVISQEILDACLRASPNISQDMLLENSGARPPELTFPEGCMIECLQGLHRVAAGKEFLPRRDWWWTVDLYLEDASEDLKISLSEEYSNSVNFSDGEIFLKLRQYNDENNKQTGTMFAEKRMWGRLSRDKRKDLKQILKHNIILDRLDALRIMPGLFVGFRIEHRFMAMKCHEEASNYLLHVLDVWKRIFGGSKQQMRSLDRQTVELLQLRAPGLSSHDNSVLAKHLAEGTIFSTIRNKDNRARIWRNLQSITYLIPSLYSFFEDVKYLQAPAKVMRQLFAPSKYSTREAMWRMFTGRGIPENQWLLQIGEGEADYQWQLGSSPDQFEYSYQQLWLYCWRYWTDLVPECPRKEEGEATPIPQKPDPRRWHGVAQLAGRLGFESDEIDRFLSLNPDREIAREALLKARSPEQFGYDDSAFEDHVTELCRIFNFAKQLPTESVKPSLVIPGPGESLARRCGRVFNNAYKDDQKHIFLTHLHNQNHGEIGGVSSFAVRMSVYFAFFGRYSRNSGEFREPVDAYTSSSSNQTEEAGEGSMSLVHISSSEIQRSEHTVSASSTTPVNSAIQVMPSINEGNLPILALEAPMQNESIAENDADIMEFVPTDPTKIVVKVWKDGQIKDREPLLSSQDTVEKVMQTLESQGYKLFNYQGRAMRPNLVFTEVTRNGSNIVIISKENEVSRSMMSAIKQLLQSDKRIRQKKRKGPG